MKVSLHQGSGLLLEPSNQEESAELNEWFNALGHELKGRQFFDKVLNAHVRITKRDSRGGVQLSLEIESFDTHQK